MRQIIRIIGWGFLIAGLVAIVGSVILTFQGFNATINLGNPAEYQFYLVPIWQLGAAAAALGFVMLMILKSGRTAP